jgi:hypothetical protein
VFSGPNRGGNGAAGQHIAIELLGEGISAEAFDVELGGGRRRTPSTPNDGPPQSRAWKFLVGVAVASVLIGGIVWLSSSRKPATDESAQPSTTVPETTTTVQLGARVVTTLAPEPTTPPTTIPDSVVINVGSPIVDLEGSTAVYFVDETNWRDLYRLDQATGVISPWVDPVDDYPSTGSVQAIFGTPDAPRSIRTLGSSYQSLRLNRDGSMWRGGGDGSLELIGADGSTIRTITAPWEALGINWIDFVGTDAEDNPVISGLDGTAFTIRPDDSLVRFAAGYPSSLEHGSFALVVCAEDGSCQSVLTTPVGSAPSLAQINRAAGQSFSPDGRWVIEETYDDSGTTQVWLTNIETGADSEVDIGTQDFGIGSDYGTVNRSTWTADSRHYVSRRRSERFGEPVMLTVLDVATGSVTSYPLPTEFGPLLPIAVL